VILAARIVLGAVGGARFAEQWRRMRARPIALALLVGLAAAPGGVARASPAAPAPPPGIEVGAELVALRDVALRQARLRKGSRVRVVHIATSRGVPVAVSLELRDGHVLHGVSYRKVKDNFRPVPR
jgi:hypothetical protein